VPMSLKSGYVRGARALRAGLRAGGVLPVLDRLARRSRCGLWLRSLLSIYDPRELAALDVPWWTLEASDLVDTFLKGRPGARAFEWGSGASTLWLARRGAAVTSVEHDPEWASITRSLLGPGLDVDLRLIPDADVDALQPADPPSAHPEPLRRELQAYVDVIDGVGGTFDVIVVDGRIDAHTREACLERGVARLAPGGIIVFDNVERPTYRQAIAAQAVPLEVTWTHGLTPSLPYPTRTAILRVAAAGDSGRRIVEEHR
jgi:predicted O-methyltransferase YrrM